MVFPLRELSACAWLTTCLVLCLVACRRPGEDAGEAGQSRGLAALPEGYYRLKSEGWSVAVPKAFTPLKAPADSTDKAWLLFVGDRRAPGKPRMFFIRHVKPAPYPSRAFGLTHLEDLRRMGPSRTIVSSRQHDWQGITVTDVEVVIQDRSPTEREWRRLFVHEQRAYTLAFASLESEVEWAAPVAWQVLDSLAKN